MNASLHLRLVALIAAIGGLLFGYDTAVISGAIGSLSHYFSLSPAEVGWAISSALVGCLAGALGADPCSTRLGRKASMALAALLFLAGSIGTALPESFAVFVWFRIVGGIGVGLASMVVPMYIAEIAPADKRGALVAYNQLAIVIGIVVVYFVNYYIALQGSDEWNHTVGWRWMFASEAIPALLYGALVLVVPESPRWLLMRGRGERAQRVLERFHQPAAATLIAAEISGSLTQRSDASWRSLMQPHLRRALWTGIGLSVFQQVTGINAILYYAPEIFKSFGSSANASLLETSYLGVINLVFTIISIFLVDRVGRRPLLLAGTGGMLLALAVVGAAAYTGSVSGWLLPFLLLFMASFSISWGPVVWVLLSEIFPNSVRSLALSIAVFIQWAANFAVSQTFPLLTGSKALNERFHGAAPFLLFAVLCVGAFIFVRRFVPETRNKTLEQMQDLWQAQTAPEK
ncbi:sugar porter family MFS transporter [Flaviaesturariibacter aridisoli]|uniref:MFS transporter n=1 Tax=Flaviaesturariibacter aridisoli TaxID=2545761 RepID=A0A4V2WM96_9BACT|nr:sugar porter family MFS transporter [Flaviaesturariibacter aridisoli]TCZ67071.1 MFS transporter [Flaviaesturariibacter aridisoli]